MRESEKMGSKGGPARPALQLTSSQSAALLKVHESSIKRWSNDGELRFTKTAGGHRRFLVEDLIAFVRHRNQSFPLDFLGEYSVVVSEALAYYLRHQSFGPLLEELGTWLNAPRRVWLSEVLLVLYRDYGIPLATLFDHLVCGLMKVVGDLWYQGILSVGGEHLISELMLDGLQLIRAQISRRKLEDNGSWPKFGEVGPVAISTTGEGGLHELGAFCVRLVLEERGWSTLYAGANLPTDELVKLQQKHGASLVCISYVHPLQISDFQRSMETLLERYDHQTPYHLVVGGLALAEERSEGRRLEDLVEDAHPFLSFHSFQSIERFDAWLLERFALQSWV